MGFPLFHLPSLVFKEIFNQLEVEELSSLVSCSKRTRILVTSIRKLPSFQEIVDFERRARRHWNAFQLLSHLNYVSKPDDLKSMVKLTVTSDSEFIIEFKGPNFRTVTATIKLGSLPKISSYSLGNIPVYFEEYRNEPMTTRVAKMDSVEMVKLVTGRLLDFFGLKVSSLRFINPEEGNENELASLFSGSLADIRIDGKTSNKSFNFILDKIQCKDQLTLNTKFPLTITRLNMKKLDLVQSGWFRIEDLLRIECEEIILRQSQLGSCHIRTYIEKWMSDGLPFLKKIHVFTNRELEWGRILQGFMQGFPLDDIFLPETIRKIQRFDGKEAKLTLDYYEFRMIIL